MIVLPKQYTQEGMGQWVADKMKKGPQALAAASEIDDIVRQLRALT
jgi:hypothetical protein